MRRREFLSRVAVTAGAVRLPRARRRRVAAVGSPALDAHTHVNSPEVADRVEALIGRRAVEPIDGPGLVRRLDRDGVERAMLLSTAYLMAADVGEGLPTELERKAVQAENDFAAAEAAKAPDRLIPFMSLNPKRPYAVDEIDRCVDLHGMRGLKLHFWNSLVDTREASQLRSVRRVIWHAARRGLPVTGHVFVGAVRGYGPDDVERLCREVIVPEPRLRFCFAHLGGAGGFSGLVQRILERLVEVVGPGREAGDRVVVDMAATLFAEGIGPIARTPPAARERMGELFRRWGPDRILWGSDNLEGALDQARRAWPLTATAWDRLTAGRGEPLLES